MKMAPSYASLLFVFAVKHNIQDLVERMLENRACDINEKSLGGMTAFMMAAKTDNLEMMELLLQNGALTFSLLQLWQCC